jgi:hypothetical protein
LRRRSRRRLLVEVAAETITARSVASRVSGRKSSNLAGAIYGTIVATAVVAGIDETSSLSPLRAFWILLASGAFFWAAHVYAYLLADRIHGHHRMKREDVSRVMSREWPLFQSSFPLAVPRQRSPNDGAGTPISRTSSGSPRVLHRGDHRSARGGGGCLPPPRVVASESRLVDTGMNGVRGQGSRFRCLLLSSPGGS